MVCTLLPAMLYKPTSIWYNIGMNENKEDTSDTLDEHIIKIQQYMETFAGTDAMVEYFEKEAFANAKAQFLAKYPKLAQYEEAFRDSDS